LGLERVGFAADLATADRIAGKVTLVSENPNGSRALLSAVYAGAREHLATSGIIVSATADAGGEEASLAFEATGLRGVIERLLAQSMEN
jgi:hypothetical protein